jgi:outer membrane protein assembly factor BamE
MFDASRLRNSLVVTMLFCGVLAGCSYAPSMPTIPSVSNALTPYKIDMVQGNVVTREQLDALKLGMSRVQVRDILGTSLLTSVFHTQRWDYVFSFSRQGAPRQSRQVSLFFNDDALEKIEADPLPSEAEFVATLKSLDKVDKLPSLEATEESLKKFPVAPKPVVQPPAVAPPANYPPLESARP